MSKQNFLISYGIFIDGTLVLLSLGKDDQCQVEETLAKAVGNGVGRTFKVYIGGGNLYLSLFEWQGVLGMWACLIYKGPTSGALEVNLSRPSATDVRNGWWPHPVETRGKDCRANRELPLQVLHGSSRTGC